MAALRTIGLLLLGSILAVDASAQRLVEWTEGPGELGLGYPVPIPVDTPLPFDGFRSYAGLHARHQALMLAHDDMDGEVVGLTAAGREIWAYVLGDPDAATARGFSEGAAMIQGAIHAREWQTPEVVTGLMEQLLDGHDDAYLHQYLLENFNIVVIPVLNVDGFLQTQRYPRENYLGSDPSFPNAAPRDGRMRRKSMPGVDEDLFTIADHLLGVDLNRNNPPFWASSNRSSGDQRSLVHHGSAPHSEPETRAMVAATGLAPADRLRAFTDMHSFAQVLFSEHTLNARRNAIQNRLLANFINHHANLPGAKRYLDVRNTSGGGIGATDGYFAQTYEIPSWTLEIEPSQGHPELPGSGADYGGLGSNGHDGFILPESQIRRVRDNLAESMVITYYSLAGPPAVTALRVTDAANGAVVHEAEWDAAPGGDSRMLHEQAIQPLQLGREYQLWLAFDKPMRWRRDGTIASLPGRPSSDLLTTLQLSDGDQQLDMNVTGDQWLDQPGGPGAGYLRYRDDALLRTVSFAAGDSAIEEQPMPAAVAISAADMVGQLTDADPATPVDWSDGHWTGYENSFGFQGDVGGNDTTLSLPIGARDQPVPFLVSPGNTAAWFDPEHAGEGFLLEVLEDQRAVVYWFTYDGAGEQRWFVGVGEIRGNEVVFDDLLVTSGGRFGPDFDPDQVDRERAGRLSILFSSCDTAAMRYGAERRYRQQLIRLTQVAGLGCETLQPDGPNRHISGSWFDEQRSGEGFIVQLLNNGEVLIYWFSYDPDGRQAWFFGQGPIDAQGRVEIDQVWQPQGGIFGDEFDPETVELVDWGAMSFEFGCESAQMEYDSVLPGFGAGSQQLIRLTRPSGVAAC